MDRGPVNSCPRLSGLTLTVRVLFALSLLCVLEANGQSRVGEILLGYYASAASATAL